MAANLPLLWQQLLWQRDWEAFGPLRWQDLLSVQEPSLAGTGEAHSWPQSQGEGILECSIPGSKQRKKEEAVFWEAGSALSDREERAECAKGPGWCGEGVTGPSDASIACTSVVPGNRQLFWQRSTAILRPGQIHLCEGPYSQPGF